LITNWEFFGLRGKQGNYYFSRSKAPKMFQLVRTSPLVEGSDLEAKRLSKLIEIRLSRTILVERQFDEKLGIGGMTGNQRKYYSSRTRAPKLFQLVGTSPLVEDRALKQNDFQNSLKIRLSRTVSVGRQCDDEIVICVITRKAWVRPAVLADSLASKRNHRYQS